MSEWNLLLDGKSCSVADSVEMRAGAGVVSARILLELKTELSFLEKSAICMVLE